MGVCVNWTIVIFIIAQAMVAVQSTHAAEPRDFSEKWIKDRLRSASTRIANCEKKKNCPDLKALKDFTGILKSFEYYKDKLAGTAEENRILRNENRVCQQPNKLAHLTGCDKRRLRQEVLLDVGIPENGSNLFSKRPMDASGAECWSNARKKKDASIIVCEFPQAINVLTKGGVGSSLITRQREYAFDTTGCLAAVRITDENIKGKKVTELNYIQCAKEWNNKPYVDMDQTTEVRKIDIIGACFRYYLLPPRESRGGSVNPANSTAPTAK